MIAAILPERGPVRSYAWVNLVSTIASGAWLTGSVLFFTRGVGLDPSTVGWGLSIAVTAGLIAMVPLGHLADRIGARRVYASLLGLQSAATVCLVFIDSVPAFLLTTAVISVCDRGTSGVVGSLIHSLTSGVSSASARAQLRAVTNIGIAVGAALAAVPIAVDTPRSYQALVLGCALAQVSAVVLLLRLPMAAGPHTDIKLHPASPALPETPGRHTAWRDTKFLAVVFTNGAFSLHYEILGIALPLWVTTRTDAPHWMVSVVVVINTAVVVGLQVAVAKNVDGPRTVRRAYWRAGACIALACLILPAVALFGPVLASAVLVVFALVYSLGEVLHASAEFCVSFDLPPMGRQGQYQSVFALGKGAARAAGPVVLVSTVTAASPLGWFIAGFVALGAAGLTARCARDALISKMRRTPRDTPAVVPTDVS